MKTQYLYVTCFTLMLPLSVRAQEHQAPTVAEGSAAAAESTRDHTPAAGGPVASLSETEKKQSAANISVQSGSAQIDDFSPEVVKKLDAKQLEGLIRQRQLMQAKNIKREAPMVTILVPLFFFLCLGGIVGGSLLYRHRQNGHRHQTLRLMIEKGAEIPPELLSPPVKPGSDLRRGILLLAAGVGTMIFLALVSTGDSPQRLWSLGLIPSLVGVGYLVVWQLDSKQDAVGQ